jgi:DNA-binding response OmpR family regulator
VAGTAVTTSASPRLKNGKGRDLDGANELTSRILVAQDDLDTRREIADWLNTEGYDVRLCDTSKRAVDLVHIVGPDLLLLDFSKPSSDTLEICRQLRQDTASPLASRLPILVFRSDPDEIDETVCLEVGADDYIGKPVHRRRFVTRIRALLRRASLSRAGDLPEQPYIVSGDLAMDLVTRRATRGGEPLPLSPLEFDLLALFVTRPGQLLTRNQILARVWHEEPNPEHTSLGVHMHWLRDKIEDDPAQPMRLQTVHGRGYVFVG